MPTVAFHTLGCKLNYAETSTLAKQFMDRGYAVVPPGEPADVFVVNSCSVTAAADRECRQVIRRALRRRGDTRVVVTGCYAQLEPEEVASIPGVDLVLGAREKFELLRHLEDAPPARAPRVHVSDIRSADRFGPAFTTEASDRTRAFLKVQDGCDYTCSFCTIPLARGASRSQPPEACVEQARGLVARGFREIVLTGVNVGDYGRRDGTDLLALLRDLAAVEGIGRIRISSIEPNLLTPDIIAFVADTPVMAPHFHIPLQSGSGEVLRLMRRRYTPADYARVAAAAHARIPGCGIGVDVIVGFPGETEACFEETVRFLDELPAAYFHVFTYSERPETPAAGLPGAVPKQTRHRRNAALRALSDRKREAFHRSLVGTTAAVLLEDEVTDGFRYGFSGNYARVGIPAGGSTANTMAAVRVTEAGPASCRGLLLPPEAHR